VASPITKSVISGNTKQVRLHADTNWERLFCFQPVL